MPASKHLRAAIRCLEKRPLLLLQDPIWPSLASLIAGEPMRGSWWSHPKGSAIFHTAGQLDDHPDVTTFKLVRGKVTFVHRSLWPAIVTAGRARERWQTTGLTGAARTLLRRVDAKGAVEASGKAAKELELRLLVASQQVHTSSGAHALQLVSWQRFARENGVSLRRRSASRARGEIEAATNALVAEFGGKAGLGWE